MILAKVNERISETFEWDKILNYRSI